MASVQPTHHDQNLRVDSSGETGGAANAELTRYLLGEMSEAEQTEFELYYFSDPQLLAELCAWRNNLIDEYVAGGLSEPMRLRFETAIENSWAINERIRFAETLQEAMEARGQAGGHRRSRSFRMLGTKYRRALLAAGILLLMLAATWLILRMVY